MEGGGGSKNLNLLCLALNNLLRDLKGRCVIKGRCRQTYDFIFHVPPLLRVGVVLGGVVIRGARYLMRRRNKRKRREKEKKAPSRTLGVTPTFLAGDVFLLLSACWSNRGGFNHQTELFNKVRSVSPKKYHFFYLFFYLPSLGIFMNTS